ncbi:hypothetical protein V8C86DRAFT_2572081, partial [Haematococcus lacustris]
MVSDMTAARQHCMLPMVMRWLTCATTASTSSGLRSGRAVSTRPRKAALITWRHSAFTSCSPCPCPSSSCCPLPLAPAAPCAGV